MMVIFLQEEKWFITASDFYWSMNKSVSSLATSKDVINYYETEQENKLFFFFKKKDLLFYKTLLKRVNCDFPFNLCDFFFLQKNLW